MTENRSAPRIELRLESGSRQAEIRRASIWKNFGQRRKPMVEDWSALIGNMNTAVRELRKASPEVMRTFSDMARAAHNGEALDGKTKELVALAIGVAVRCSPCIAYHAEGAVKQGASQAEVAETLAM